MKNKLFHLPELLLLLFFSFFLLSCKLESNRVHFSNNLDDLSVWFDRSTLTDSVSHSGRFSTFVNPASPYGFAFRAKFRELSDKKIKKIRVSFYANERDSLSLSSMVFEVRTKKNEVAYWRCVKVHEMATPLKWIPLTQEFDISEEHFSGDDEVRIYPWCQGNTVTFFDDYLFEFYW